MMKGKESEHLHFFKDIQRTKGFMGLSHPKAPVKGKEHVCIQAPENLRTQAAHSGLFPTLMAKARQDT